MAYEYIYIKLKEFRHHIFIQFVLKIFAKIINLTLYFKR